LKTEKTNRFVQAIVNHSGEYCFRDILDGEYIILVEPDPLYNYFYLKPPLQEPWPNSFEVPVVLPLSISPLVEVRLAPKPSYPFSSSATLIRGRVVRGGQKARVPNARVRTSYEQYATRDVTKRLEIDTLSDQQGNFVLFFLKLPEETQRVTLQAELNGQKSEEKAVRVRDGTVVKTEVSFP
jgi:hypothetical protein